MTLEEKRTRSGLIQYKELAINSEGLLVSQDKRTISGYAAVFGNRDEALDILVQGCCAKSIKEHGPESSSNRKIVFLWQHDMSEPLGRITVLREDDYGLYFEAVIDKIPEGDRCLQQLESGTINQFSIGFRYIWDKCEWDEEKEALIVKELVLFEISAVSIGCNEDTYFMGMKAEQLESHRNKLDRECEKALKDLPHETQFQLRQIITKYLALERAEPSADTQEQVEPPIDYKYLLKNLELK